MCTFYREPKGQIEQEGQIQIQYTTSSSTIKEFAVQTVQNSVTSAKALSEYPVQRIGKKQGNRVQKGPISVCKRESITHSTT